MKNLTVQTITKACQGTLHGPHSDRPIAGVVIDSRLIEPGYVFIASRGEKVDGHQFIDQAFLKGAAAVICETLPEDMSGPCILVNDSIKALQDVAKWYRTQLNLKVVGITGSAGKTSTKECISAVLSQKYKVLKTEGNLNNEIGLPLTVLSIRGQHEVAVIEMGISAFGEMEILSDIAKPDIGLITNIGESHLENLKDRAGVLQAKREIFRNLPLDGLAILNGDDDLLKAIIEINGIQPVTYGLDHDNQITAKNIKSNGLSGSEFDVQIRQSSHSIKDDIASYHAKISLPGKHMIMNALSATAVGLALHMTMDEIITGLTTIQPTPGRSNVIHLPSYTIIDDCYNANPSSMKAALDLLATATTRKIAILGDMKELGFDEVSLHQEIGKYVTQANIDVLLCAGPLASELAKAAQGAGMKTVFYYESKQKLITSLADLIKIGDTILVKASHSMGFEDIVTSLTK